MSKKLNKKKLIKMIDTGFTELTEDKIKSLISEELSKDEAEIDMDYIDVCYQLLEAKKDDKAESKPKIRVIKKPKRLFVAAAAAVLVLLSGTVAFAGYVDFNIPQSIAALVRGNAELDFNLEHADTTAEGYKLTDTALAKQLAEFGISPVTLPEEMVKESCKITEIKNKTIDETISKDASVDFEFKGYNGYFLIMQYFEKGEESTGVSTVMDVVSGQMIRANGMDILVFEGENVCTIQYKDNLTRYDFQLETDIDTALEFAKTIK